ncbi:hypothetical protein NW762_012048 [Fusarium torreyae]|uniref:Uncharacterized protein n=1 Tax=Fusarium torreyae TaxID=1237075 RepID=A0A9W8RR06_9HYPO|nr:hypothetical protein NW762_012048 [Fusarium torreyae]
MDQDTTADNQRPRKKRLRKSRGRGLRTTTGWLVPLTHLDSDPQAENDGYQSGHDDGGWLNDGPSPTQPQSNVVAPRLQPPPLCANDISFLNVATQQVSTSAWSPDSAFWTTDFASTRWLDLLANDAAQADSGFSLAPTPVPREGDERQPNIESLHNRLSEVAEAERRTWQAGTSATLSDYEASLLRHFAERCSLWLDLFNQQRLFSTCVIRLALRNSGLMNAILALAARHRAKLPRSRNQDPEGTTDNEWIRHYYETLHYVQEALTYTSYTNSEELLATAIVISTYEMLDESDGRGNWQRHLKGVFWIQRSQDVNGSSGGLRQAVWWAWLRQDIWAAFREKRPCFSFWVPVQSFRELDQHDLADRAIYLLSQAVNYYAHSRSAITDPITHRAAPADLSRVRKELLQSIEDWKAHLGNQYKPLPTPSGPSDIFTGLWVHPPEFGAALQAISFAQILVTLHSPTPAGFNGYLRMQKTLSQAVDTICGIAMELRDEGCQILSAQCLYGAGLCLQDTRKRAKLISLIEACEDRVSWPPMAMWRDDLRQEWAKADHEGDRDF